MTGPPGRFGIRVSDIRLTSDSIFKFCRDWTGLDWSAGTFLSSSGAPDNLGLNRSRASQSSRSMTLLSVRGHADMFVSARPGFQAVLATVYCEIFSNSTSLLHGGTRGLCAAVASTGNTWRLLFPGADCWRKTTSSTFLWQPAELFRGHMHAWQKSYPYSQ